MAASVFVATEIKEIFNLKKCFAVTKYVFVLI